MREGERNSERERTWEKRRRRCMLIERAEEKKNMLVRTCKELHSVCSGALSAGKMQTKDSLTFRERKKKKKEEGE